MIRSLPIRSASRICPRALLILCAPVCARSSRLNHTLAPPHLRVSRSANISGVGRPTKSRDKESSSSRAWIRVSGTYRPPKPPKYPLSTFCRTHEPPNPLAVLLAGPLLQRTRSVDPVWLEELDSLPHVLRRQPPGDDDVTAPLHRFRQLPVEPCTGPSSRFRAPRVQQEQVSLVLFEHPERLRVTHPYSLHDRKTGTSYGSHRLWRLVAVKLGEVQSDLLGDPQHLFRVYVHEHPDLQYAVGERDAYPARLFDAHLAGALSEDKSDRVCASVGSPARVPRISYAADFSEDHTEEILLPLPGDRVLRDERGISHRRLTHQDSVGPGSRSKIQDSSSQSCVKTPFP